MTSLQTDLLTIFSEDPALAFDLLRHQLFELPREPWVRAQPTPEDSDAIMLACAHESLRRSVGPARLALCMQLADPDDRQAPTRWLNDELRVLAELGCPTRSAVVAIDAAAARWVARLPGPAHALLGPAQVPRVHSLRAVRRRPALALLSMLMHGRDDRQIGVTALQGLTLAAQDLHRRCDWLEERRQLILRHAAPGERARLQRLLDELRPPDLQGASLRSAHSAP